MAMYCDIGINMKTFKLKKDENTETYSNSIKEEWKIVECICGCRIFEIISTAPYETSARCTKCGFMDVVHDG